MPEAGLPGRAPARRWQATRHSVENPEQSRGAETSPRSPDFSPEKCFVFVLTNLWSLNSVLNAGGRTRTDTPQKRRGILSPLRLPFRHSGSLLKIRFYFYSGKYREIALVQWADIFAK